MEIIERIRQLCRENGTSVTDLEKELGFSNGSLAKAKDIPSSRILEISKRLNVSMEYIMTGEDPKFSTESGNLVAKIRNNAGLYNALIQYFDLSNTKKKYVLDLINLFSTEEK